MFKMDRTLLKPNVPVTVRFTSILYEWFRREADK